MEYYDPGLKEILCLADNELMTHHIFDKVRQLAECTDILQLCKTFERLMCHYGFDRYALAFAGENDPKNALTIFATYEKEWSDYYYEHEYQLIDPVMLKTHHDMAAPFLWSDVWNDLELTRKQTTLFHEARDYGISSGFTIPVPRFQRQNASVSLVSSVCDTAEIEKIIGEKSSELALLSVYFQQIAEQMSCTRKPQTKRTLENLLTPREIECLQWWSRGKTDLETASILRIAGSTVKQHITSCCKKMSVYSRQQACLKALQLGLIQFS